MQNKDIIDDYSYLNCNKREILIRFTMIFLLSVLSLVFDISFPYSDLNFGVAFIILFVKIFVLWHGSMLLINFSIRKFSMFEETTKLIIFQVVSLFIFISIICLLEIMITENIIKQKLNYDIKSNLFLGTLLITYLISTIYASVSFFQQWKINLLKAKELEKSNLEAQYATLIHQINPHFLFNSLNVLLVLIKDNSTASKYVESISEIIRYMLQSNTRYVVTVEEELEIAEKYVFIQKNRFGTKFKVNFNIKNQFNEYLIPPLTLQILMENIVKHNEISEEHPLTVNLYTLDDKYLVIENALQAKREKETSLGIGLNNIQKRYLHIFNEDVLVSKTDTFFTVKLPLMNPNSYKK